MTRRVYLPRPRPDQAPILADDSPRKVLTAGRRYGKTTIGIPAALEGHGLRRRLLGALAGAKIWWVVPDMRTTGRDRWRDLKYATVDARTGLNEVEHRIELPGGGSLTLQSAHRVDSLRGSGLDGVVVDETSLLAREAWTEALRPALSDRQGWAMFLFTPKGRHNWTWPLWLRGADPDQAEAAQAAEADYPGAARPGWRSFRHASAENPMLTADDIADARDDLGELLFAQEYLAEFVTLAGGIFRREWIRYYDDLGDRLVLDTDAGPLVVPRRTLRVRATVDPAVSTKTAADYTAVATYGLLPTRDLVLLDMFRDRLEGPDLAPALQSLWRRFRHTRIGIERVAFQLSLVQGAARLGLPVVPITADADKVSRAMYLAARLEGAHVYVPRSAPWLPTLVDELVEFRADMSHAHDDQVDALAYAVADAADDGATIESS